MQPRASDSAAVHPRRLARRWCWDDHFLDWFADRGYRAVAVNLPAHGGRLGTKALHRHSVPDYLAAVTAVADDMPSPPAPSDS